jgi:hypothetical protein
VRDEFVSRYLIRILRPYDRILRTGGRAGVACESDALVTNCELINMDIQTGYTLACEVPGAAVAVVQQQKCTQ